MAVKEECCHCLPERFWALPSQSRLCDVLTHYQTVLTTVSLLYMMSSPQTPT